jgi:hypothetical protein
MLEIIIPEMKSWGDIVNMLSFSVAVAVAALLNIPVGFVIRRIRDEVFILLVKYKVSGSSELRRF